MYNSSPALTTSRRRHRRVIGLAAAGAALAGAASLALTGAAAAAPVTSTAVCDGPGWQVTSASIDGAPAGLDAGDLGRTYLWHDEGWHLRTTDINNSPHHYTGTISASPGATFLDVHKIRLDPADHLWVDDHQLLHYSFVTHAGIDGIDFRIAGCDHSEQQKLTFELRKNGAGDPSLIDLGHSKDHPATDPFVATRG
ncbi:MAG: hypothetical protein JOY78_14225 [Pseudonocardia sp.]|nr:hypothetical protein [Pseudonocardia sp.]